MLRQFRPSVCPSVTCVHCIKTAEHIEILPLSDRSIILVFRHQGLLRKSDGFIPNGGAGDMYWALAASAYRQEGHTDKMHRCVHNVKDLESVLHVAVPSVSLVQSAGMLYRII